MGGTLSLTNVTIAGNMGPNSFGGGISNITGSATAVEARNTIVANNTQGLNGQCATSKTTSGGVTSLGGNLEFPGNSCIFEVVADPKLGSLADNGGPTRTRALGEGSAAIDAGTNTGCPATDQRGVTRPKDGDRNGTAACDIGAVEIDSVGISINNAQITEGDSGLRSIGFTISLEAAPAGPVSVNYATQDGSATADVDYASSAQSRATGPPGSRRAPTSLRTSRRPWRPAR